MTLSFLVFVDSFCPDESGPADKLPLLHVIDGDTLVTGNWGVEAFHGAWGRPVPQSLCARNTVPGGSVQDIFFTAPHCVRSFSDNGLGSTVFIEMTHFFQRHSWPPFSEGGCTPLRRASTTHIIMPPM
jgi:hypothetical protein